MTVVTADSDPGNPMSMAREIQSCHAALLYADMVTLVSPRAALLDNAVGLANLGGIPLMQLMRSVAPKYFPDLVGPLTAATEVLNKVPPRSQRTVQERKAFQRIVRELAEQPAMIRIKQLMQEGAERVLADSGLGQLRQAIDAGVLEIQPVDGAHIEGSESTGDLMMIDLLATIDDLLSEPRGRYPLFDTKANALVRNGVELGYLQPVPLARRWGADAAMADGLLDRLPAFGNASTSEILDIRSELSGALIPFRSGVRELTDGITVAPEDPAFGAEIEDAWNMKVAPEIEKIEAAIDANRSLADLAKRMGTDIEGVGAVGAAALSPSLEIAVPGNVPLYAAAAAFVGAYGLTAAKALRDQHREISAARKADFYFMYRTEETLRTN